jgi:hypothetical protein
MRNFLFFILVPKAEICMKVYRKIRWFPADFPTDFSFKELKPKDLNIQGLICNKKDTGLKPKIGELTLTKMIFKHFLCKYPTPI